MNHSCAANVDSRYDDVGRPAAVTVYATRNIAQGEEVCHAYIDEEPDADKRAGMLRHYGFECACPRCVNERAAPRYNLRPRACA